MSKPVVVPIGTATSAAQSPGKNRLYNACRSLVALASGVLILLLQFGVAPGFSASTDGSWGEVISWGAFHGAQWGRDVVFTYGPLGFLQNGLGVAPDDYWRVLLMQQALAIATACLLTVNLWRLPLVSGIGFLLATLAFGIHWSGGAWLLVAYPLAALALARIAAADGTPPRRHLAVGSIAVYVALLPLIKFSAVPLWLGLLPLGTIMLWRVRALAATFLLVSVMTPALAWIACGQHLANLGPFLAHSWQVATGYVAAMQLDPSNALTDWVTLGAALFGLTCAALAGWSGRRRTNRVAACAMLALTIALAYRAGTLRADYGHLMDAWLTFAWVAPLLVGYWYEGSSTHGTYHAALALLLMLPALLLPQLSSGYITPAARWSRRVHATLAYAGARAGMVLHPAQSYAAHARRWTADRASLKLPAISHAVGAGSIDLLMNNQSYLLANDLNYRPRPVFQSYSAYTGALAALNDDFFLSPRAPDWVMLDWSTIDRRYPTSDDARALIRVLQDYSPRLSEGRFILFQKSAANHADFTVGPEHRVVVSSRSSTPLPTPPSGAWFATVNVHLTAYGKLAKLLFREPPLYIEIQTRNGARQRFRLVRAIAKSGFMLSPALASNGDYLDWLQGDDGRDVVAVRLLQQRVLGHAAFKPYALLRLYPLSIPRRQPATIALYGTLYPGFNAVPTAITGLHHLVTFDRQRALFLGAPGALTFRLPPGHYSVTAQFGVLPNALANAVCLRNHPDGVGLQVGVGGNSSTPGAAQYIDPFADPQHRYSANYVGQITVAANQSTVVRMNNGPPGSNGACDWSWIRNLRFTRVGVNGASVHTH